MSMPEELFSAANIEEHGKRFGAYEASRQAGRDLGAQISRGSQYAISTIGSDGRIDARSFRVELAPGEHIAGQRPQGEQLMVSVSLAWQQTITQLLKETGEKLLASELTVVETEASLLASKRRVVWLEQRTQWLEQQLTKATLTSQAAAVVDPKRVPQVTVDIVPFHLTGAGAKAAAVASTSQAAVVKSVLIGVDIAVPDPKPEFVPPVTRGLSQMPSTALAKLANPYGGLQR
jgi:hypothetical protein